MLPPDPLDTERAAFWEALRDVTVDAIGWGLLIGLIVAALYLVTSITGAHASSCYTSCWPLGDQTYCITDCY